MLEQDRFTSHWSTGAVDIAHLTKLSISGLFKERFTSLDSSGIVIAGFGENDFFPRLVAYRCYGLVLGKLILSEDKNKAQRISQTNTSAIVPFAQDEMIRTFVWGSGAGFLEQVDEGFMKSMDEFHGELLKADLAADVSGDDAKAETLRTLRGAVNEKFRNILREHMFESHSRPLRRVIGSLPVDELAELAETLVLLESLKERVTRPSTSVSGPIDVAVISKNDGFIWIKRKHYFDPKLNPRYFANRGFRGN